MGHVHLVAVGLHVVEEALQVVGREVLLGHDDDRRSGGKADGREVLGRIVFQVRVEGGRGAVGAHMAHHDGVAVRLRLRGAGDARGAAGAGDVLDHDLLAERAGHVVAYDAGDHVCRAAGREGHDHGDRTGADRSGPERRWRQCRAIAARASATFFIVIPPRKVYRLTLW